MQHRIITPGPLHDENGRLIETGYATRLIKTYDRGRIAARPFRIKEWDYYAVCTDRFALALTIDHNGYMTMDSISLLDFEENSQVTSSRISLPAFAKRSLPPTSAKGDIRVAGKGYEISFENDGSVRHLRGHMDRFTKDSGITFDLALTDAPEESMVIVTPFRNHPEAFYYNQKINCMRVSGQIRHREKEYRCSPAETFAVLDWGRGVWTYDNRWYWGSGNGIVDGKPFGFNIGYGFGDTSAASENMLFYDGVGHKLDDVEFHIPADSYMKPWKFTSSDGRFEMDFVPVLDRAAKIDAKVILSDQHQVFGRMTGKAVLDDGRVLEIKDLMCFAEDVHNRY